MRQPRKCYYSTGNYGRAREMHEQRKAMAEALGDRVRVATACGNLGKCYDSTGDYVRALAMHEENRAICEALGDRAGEGVRQLWEVLLEHGGILSGDLLLHGAV